MDVLIIGGHFEVYILLQVISHAYPCWGQEGLFGPAFVAGHVSDPQIVTILLPSLDESMSPGPR